MYTENLISFFKIKRNVCWKESCGWKIDLTFYFQDNIFVIALYLVANNTIVQETSQHVYYFVIGRSCRRTYMHTNSSVFRVSRSVPVYNIAYRPRRINSLLRLYFNTCHRTRHPVCIIWRNIHECLLWEQY